MMKNTQRLCLALPALFLLAACAGADPQAATPPKLQGNDRAADRQACLAKAEREFNENPAISSGKTSYLPGFKGQVYAACMRSRGHEP